MEKNARVQAGMRGSEMFGKAGTKEVGQVCDRGRAAEVMERNAKSAKVTHVR